MSIFLDQIWLLASTVHCLLKKTKRLKVTLTFHSILSNSPNSNQIQELKWTWTGILNKEGKRWVLLQQALGWASLQHIRYDDGRLPALKVRVIPSARDSDPEAEPWCLRDTHLHVTQQVRGTHRNIRTTVEELERDGIGQREWKDKIGGMERKINEGMWWSERYRERAEKGGEIERLWHGNKEERNNTIKLKPCWTWIPQKFINCRLERF